MRMRRLRLVYHKLTLMSVTAYILHNTINIVTFNLTFVLAVLQMHRFHM